MGFLLFFIFILCGLAVPSWGEPAEESALQVWKVEGRQWTVEEEIRFGQWVEESIREDFFIRHKIPIDCADVPYATRWIYARLAHLPAAATTKDGKLIGHWSKDWAALPTHPEWQKDQRFRAALLHMLSETTTRSLPSDTYPIRIDRESVTPGTVFFVPESHSGIIGSVCLDGSYAHPLQTWEATLPAKLQKIQQKSFLLPRPDSTTHSGLVKFRWPVFEGGHWTYLPPSTHPFYSEEQYGSGFDEGVGDFVEAVAKRIDPGDYDPWEKMLKVLETTARFVRERVPIVLEGYKRCHKGGCPEGSDLWEIYSTPGRDGLITLMMDHLSQIIQSNHLDEERVRKAMEAIRIEISKGRFVTFAHLFQNHLWLSPHPEDSIEARWGLRKCDLLLSRIQSARQSIRFIQKVYGRRDPKYAEFSIRQQQEILRRLYEEWDRSRCEETQGRKGAKRK